MNIKKLNELFDDEIQKNLNPDISKDDLNKDIDNNFASVLSIQMPVSIFFKKLRYFVPVINRCIVEDDNHFVTNDNDVFVFIIRNESFHVSVSIYFRSKSTIDMCILYQKSEYRGDVFIKDITTGETDYCYLEEFDNIDIDETINILNNNFLPLLKRLGFNEDYYLNRATNLERSN